VRRAVVNDPEDAAGIMIRRSRHDLIDQSIEGCNAVFGFTAAEDSSVVHVQGSDIGPGATAKVLVLDRHGSRRPTVLGAVLSTAGLNAGLFVGGDDELLFLERTALPLAGV
jgi:hypothetical protein